MTIPFSFCRLERTSAKSFEAIHTSEAQVLEVQVIIQLLCGYRTLCEVVLVRGTCTRHLYERYDLLVDRIRFRNVPGISERPTYS